MNTEQAMREALDGTCRRIVETGSGCAYETVSSAPKAVSARTQFSPEEDAKLLAMQAEGTSIVDIALVMERTLHSVQSRLKRMRQGEKTKARANRREEYLERHRAKRARVAEMYNAGADIRGIAKAVDMAPTTLRSVLSHLRKDGKIGYRESRPKLSRDEVEQLHRMYKEGRRASVIAAALGISAVTVWKYTQRLRGR